MYLTLPPLLPDTDSNPKTHVGCRFLSFCPDLNRAVIVGSSRFYLYSVRVSGAPFVFETADLNLVLDLDMAKR
jgi:hypothetical protein